MRAQCAQMRAQHYISSIDGQTTGHIESTGMEQGAATAASAKFECGARAARISRVAQSKTK
jgi:hypothetical protein